jgi:hypothetical protein
VKSRLDLDGEAWLGCVVRKNGSHKRSLSRRCPREYDGNLGTEAGG